MGIYTLWDVPFILSPKQIELFRGWYKIGYDLYTDTDTDYVAWLMDNHPEEVPDKILGEIGSELDQARSDSFQSFESEFKSPSSEGVNSGDFLNAFELSGMITGDIEQSSGDQMLQSPVSQPRRDSSSTNDSNNIGKPSLE